MKDCFSYIDEKVVFVTLYISLYTNIYFFNSVVHLSKRMLV